MLSTLADSRPLIIAKEEQLILDDRPAGGGAELVSPEFALLFLAGRSKPLIRLYGIEFVIAQEFSRATVELVAT